MVQQLKILNSKETKEVYALLEQQFGFAGKLDVVWLLSEKKERLYIFTQDLAGFDLSRIRVDSMGLYVGTFYKGTLRLTIEGTQLIGPMCTKNVVELAKPELQRWMLGEDYVVADLASSPACEEGFVILRSGPHWLGCGKLQGEKILNYIPKTRYVHALYDD